MGTNENEKNINNEMQKTQKIVILDELLKDTENSIIQKIDVTKSSSKMSAEPIVQADEENISVNNIQGKVQNDNLVNIQEEVQNNIKDVSSGDVNIEEGQTDSHKNGIKSYKIEVDKIETENVEADKVEIDKVKTEETLKIKEKQHAQDKKDYRLERMLFDRINKMQGKIKESLVLIKKFERINAKEENLPNIVTTLHDKLTQEVIKQFRTVGIEFNMKSYLVQSIVSDLLNKFEDGITEFRNCSENLNFVREVQEDFESKVELAPTSKVKNFFARLRGMFKPEKKQERIEQLERERQEKKLGEANIHLIKYKFINSELEKYTIKNNIVSSLSREILHGQGSGLTLNIKEFIENKISFEMNKLGLENLIPVLEDNLYEEYKLKDEGISKDEFMSLSVGEVRKNIKVQKAELIINKVNTVVTAKVEDEEMVG